MKHLKLFEQDWWSENDPFGEESRPKEKIEIGDYIKVLNNREGNHTFKEGDILEVEKILNLNKTYYFVKIPTLIRKMSNKKHIGFEAFMENNVRKATEEEVKNSKKFINRIKHLLEKDEWDPFGEEIKETNIFIERESYKTEQVRMLDVYTRRFKIYIKISNNNFLYFADLKYWSTFPHDVPVILYLNEPIIIKRNVDNLRFPDEKEREYIKKNLSWKKEGESYKDYLEDKYNLHITI